MVGGCGCDFDLGDLGDLGGSCRCSAVAGEAILGGSLEFDGFDGFDGLTGTVIVAD